MIWLPTLDCSTMLITSRTTASCGLDVWNHMMLPTTTTIAITTTTTIVDYTLLLEVIWLPTQTAAQCWLLRVLRRVAVLMFEIIWLPTTAYIATTTTTTTVHQYCDYYRLLHYYRKDTQKSASASGPSDKDTAEVGIGIWAERQRHAEVGIGIWAERLDIRVALSRLVVRPPSLKAPRWNPCRHRHLGRATKTRRSRHRHLGRATKTRRSRHRHLGRAANDTSTKSAPGTSEPERKEASTVIDQATAEDAATSSQASSTKGSLGDNDQESLWASSLQDYKDTRKSCGTIKTQESLAGL